MRKFLNHLVRALWIMLLSLSLLLTSGCIYRQTIVQGSIITAAEVAELELGMSKDQVQYILGSPSVVNAMNSERWEYVFIIRNRQARVFTGTGYLLFENNQLSEIDLTDYFEQLEIYEARN